MTIHQLGTQRSRMQGRVADGEPAVWLRFVMNIPPLAGGWVLFRGAVESRPSCLSFFLFFLWLFLLICLCLLCLMCPFVFVFLFFFSVLFLAVGHPTHGFSAGEPDTTLQHRVFGLLLVTKSIRKQQQSKLEIQPCRPEERGWLALQETRARWSALMTDRPK